MEKKLEETPDLATLVKKEAHELTERTGVDVPGELIDLIRRRLLSPRRGKPEEEIRAKARRSIRKALLARAENGNPEQDPQDPEKTEIILREYISEAFVEGMVRVYVNSHRDPLATREEMAAAREKVIRKIKELGLKTTRGRMLKYALESGRNFARDDIKRQNGLVAGKLKAARSESAKIEAKIEAKRELIAIRNEFSRLKQELIRSGTKGIALTEVQKKALDLLENVIFDGIHIEELKRIHGISRDAAYQWKRRATVLFKEAGASEKLMEYLEQSMLIKHKKGVQQESR
ncbi:MAG: hypothetical protein WC651_02120 [Candidatus Gracilibacteria bacterium]|jgi:hypothetical protein